MKFSDHLWRQTLPIYHEIINHPFNRELANGTLSRLKFNFYMEQDSYYLIEFAKALATIAGKAPSASLIHNLLNFSQGALIAERELHTNFIKPEYDPENLMMTPACHSYTRHLIATAATATTEEAMAAILPCFWIYREMGREFSEQSIESNPYTLWINTYSSPEFDETAELAISIVDELANQSSPKILKEMQRAFEFSALYEWHFWNDAYKQVTFQTSVYTENLTTNNTG